jgi:aspartate/methionine/tyrosine aminotransferase
MHWAKIASRARFNLATSGVAYASLKDLPVTLEDLEISGPSSYGYEALRGEIAQHYDVSPDSVVTAAGASMANHLAMAALTEPGDEVLIENPAYELLVATARFLGGDVRRFERRRESGFALDPDEVRKEITHRTRLIVITNLHNPSSALAGERELREIGDLARSVGARVLVDEVYLDCVYENTPRSSVHLGPEFLVTSSLTKVYGLSGLRCGWILAEPGLAQTIWRLSDLFASIDAFPAEAMSVVAFRNLSALRDRARRILDADRVTLNCFLDGHPEIDAPRTAWGTTAFLRAPDKDVDRLIDRLRSDHDTSVVPGRFFDAPDSFRVGMGVNSEMFSEGLNRLSAAVRR